VLPCAAVRCSSAVCYRVLPCVAVCCSALQRVAVYCCLSISVGILQRSVASVKCLFNMVLRMLSRSNTGKEHNHRSAFVYIYIYSYTHIRIVDTGWFRDTETGRQKPQSGIWPVSCAVLSKPERFRLIKDGHLPSERGKET